jgi:hypothetical protein
VAEWQTQRIQNPPTKNRVGSTPTFGTHARNPTGMPLDLSQHLVLILRLRGIGFRRAVGKLPAQ